VPVFGWVSSTGLTTNMIATADSGVRVTTTSKEADNSELHILEAKVVDSGGVKKGGVTVSFAGTSMTVGSLPGLVTFCDELGTVASCETAGDAKICITGTTGDELGICRIGAKTATAGTYQIQASVGGQKLKGTSGSGTPADPFFYDTDSAQAQYTFDTPVTYDVNQSGVRALPPGAAEANNADFVTLEALIRDVNKIGVAGQTVTFEATTTPGSVTFCNNTTTTTCEAAGDPATCVTDDGNGGLPKGTCRIKVKGATAGLYETAVRLGATEYLMSPTFYVDVKKYDPSPVQYSLGRSISGTVFIDNGGGTDTEAYNQGKDGNEKALPGVAVKVTSSDGATTFSTATTGANGSYRLSIAGVAALTPVKVVVTPPSGYIVVSADESTTGGTVDLPLGTISFTLPDPLDTSYAGVDFGLVKKPLLSSNTTQNTDPNMPVFHPIRYDAYTPVETTFTLDVSTLPQGWTAVLVEDTTCKGNDGTVLASAANPDYTRVLAGGTTATGGVPPHFCMAVKVTPHAGGPEGYIGDVKVSALTRFKITSPARDSGQTDTRSMTATTKVAQRFVLIKSALKETSPDVWEEANVAAPGTIIKYVLEYKNPTANPVTEVVITDSVPDHTTYVGGSAVIITQPTGGTCALVPPEPANGAGPNSQVKWTIDTLGSNTSGEVEYKVKVDQ
jgi:uncharacterized repeat protein (TIGR01451 family)